MVEIIPSIIANTKEELEAAIRKYEPHVERVHLDIMDGVFTHTKTIPGFEELQNINTTLNFDIHLMVVKPMDYLIPCFKTKADRIFIHAEAEDVKESLMAIRANGRKAGLVLNPESNVESTEEYLSMIDYIQFMTVQPGKYGAEFLPEVVNKIREFHDKYPETPIAADGGIHPEKNNVHPLVEAGASILVVGSHILLEGKDIEKAIKEIAVGN